MYPPGHQAVSNVFGSNRKKIISVVITEDKDSRHMMLLDGLDPGGGMQSAPRGKGSGPPSEQYC